MHSTAVDLPARMKRCRYRDSGFQISAGPQLRGKGGDRETAHFVGHQINADLHDVMSHHSFDGRRTHALNRQTGLD